MSRTPEDERPEKLEKCDCCGYETTALEFYDPPGFVGQNSKILWPKGKWLCWLCAATPASTHADYMMLYDGEHVDTLRTICYVGNVILAAIRGEAGQE